MNYMHRLIEESVINISREYPSSGVLEALVYMRPHVHDTVDRLRAKFFILLDQDLEMRKKICTDNGKSSVVKHTCIHKANRFFDELHQQVLPTYAQDQTIPLEKFIDMLRETYISS